MLTSAAENRFGEVSTWQSPSMERSEPSTPSPGPSPTRGSMWGGYEWCQPHLQSITRGQTVPPGETMAKNHWTSSWVLLFNKQSAWDGALLRKVSEMGFIINYLYWLTLVEFYERRRIFPGRHQQTNCRVGCWQRRGSLGCWQAADPGAPALKSQTNQLLPFLWETQFGIKRCGGRSRKGSAGVYSWLCLVNVHWASPRPRHGLTCKFFTRDFLGLRCLVSKEKEGDKWEEADSSKLD